MQTARRNQFKVEPKNEKVRENAPLKIAVLQTLQSYRYLPTRYIHALVGGDYKHLQYTLTQMRHDMGVIDARWAGQNALYQDAVYFVTRKGEQFLKDHGLYERHTKTGNDFHHELMACLIQASFTLGAKANGLKVLTAHDILIHPECPVQTRHRKEPFVMRTTFSYQVDNKPHTVTKDVETDGEFFGLSGDEGTLFIPGFEADRRTEPLEPDDYDRPSIKQKFLQYRQLAHDRAYEHQFGFEPHSYVIPFITINEWHMHSMMRVVENITNGKGSKLFIFKALPNFAAFDKFPPADGHMLTQPWKRVGHPDFDILKLLKAR